MEVLPFVDTHFHLHDMKHPGLRYAWLEPEAVHPTLGDVDPLKSQHYWVQDYIAETRFADISKAVHVQAAVGTPDPVEETRWLQSFADEFGYPQGIVAECHLAEADARQVLERHLGFANMRGVREIVPGDQLANPRWQDGAGMLAEHDLVSCIFTTYENLPHVQRLADRFPQLAICIEHCAYPMERSPEYFAAWQAAIRELARCPNVWMKVSGLGMADRLWTVDSIRPWVLACIDAYTPARIVFGTNWPVDRMFSSYPDVVAAYRAIVASFSIDEQRGMLAKNAEQLFRI